MLSSDKNVESIAQLVEVLKHYLGLHAEYLKLDVIDKVVRLLTATALAIVFFLVVIGVLLFFWFGVAQWLSAFMGLASAYFAVAGFNILLLLMLVAFRGPLIERPLVRFLASLLMS